MNELPVIGYPRLRKELWDRPGANIASRWKEMYSEKLFKSTHKKTILERDQRFFAVVLSQTDLENIDTRKM